MCAGAIFLFFLMLGSKWTLAVHLSKYQFPSKTSIHIFGYQVRSICRGLQNYCLKNLPLPCTFSILKLVNVNEFSYAMKFSIGEGNIRQKVLDDFKISFNFEYFFDEFKGREINSMGTLNVWVYSPMVWTGLWAKGKKRKWMSNDKA